MCVSKYERIPEFEIVAATVSVKADDNELIRPHFYLRRCLGRLCSVDDKEKMYYSYLRVTHSGSKG